MYKIEWLDEIANIPAQQWNAIVATDNPFIQHAFLLALEESGAVNRDSGWQPQHLLVYRGEKLVALLPLYQKWHSYGEYVFDFGWAEAYHRHGLEYYPKLLSAIPFTPSMGPRLCVAKSESRDDIVRVLMDEIRGRHGDKKSATMHLLFAGKELHEKLHSDQHLLLRRGIQYHWLNKGFSEFDDFLATLKSRNRKSMKRERNKVIAQNIEMQRLEGSEIEPTLWREFHRFYQMTYLKRSGHGGYLSQDFFERIGRTMPESLMLVIARYEGKIVAAALNFKDSRHLYGRYWGCLQEFDFLHFETCYYQGIEYCIEKGLICFDAGAQGQHKLKRGFEPVWTWSSHWINESGFRRAIDDFIVQENRYLEAEMIACKNALPFSIKT